MQGGANQDALPPKDNGEVSELIRELLSPALIEELASLALASEGAADIAEALERSGHLLDRYAAEPTDLGAMTQLLRRKVDMLRELNSQLSTQVMRHSHRIEDAASLAKSRSNENL